MEVAAVRAKAAPQVAVVMVATGAVVRAATSITKFTLRTAEPIFGKDIQCG